MLMKKQFLRLKSSGLTWIVILGECNNGLDMLKKKHFISFTNRKHNKNNKNKQFSESSLSNKFY